MSTDFGHIVNGEYNGNEMKFQPLNRNTVILEQRASYEKRWDFNAGFKAMIWWPFQELPTEPQHRRIRVDFRLSQISARRNFGAMDYFELGFFPYKYNPDARNLGEYLYRSGTYPGIVRSMDGMNLMNSSVFEAYGVHGHYSMIGGIIQHDFNLFSELISVPVGDVTPAYEISINLPIFQLGAGAAYNRFFTYNSRQTSPRSYSNGYFSVDSVGGGGIEFEGPFDLAPSFPSTVIQRIQTGDSTVHPLHYYTQRGVKLMARASIDLGILLLPEAKRNLGDLRIFAEMAILGWQNQIFFYEDRTRRMPIMFGANIPTFRMLDLLSVQAEYYAARFANSNSFNYFAYPVWTVAPGYSAAQFKRDDWKWSVNASRAVNRLLTVHAQVANDHLRLLEFNGNPSSTPLTQTPKNWYYLIRLECGL